MPVYHGACQCGAVTFQIALPQSQEFYTARAFDCDYCQQFDAAYLSASDAQIEINHVSKLQRQTQGSKQAEFLHCQNCQSLIAVILPQKPIVGAINARKLLDVSVNETIASPRQLSAEEKRRRWQTLWAPCQLND